MAQHIWHKPLILAIFCAAIAAAAASELPRERQAELNYLVRQDCGSCHGMTLKGGLGKPLDAARFEDVPADAIADVILDGISGTPMPPWRGLISEEDALWIAENLKAGTIK
ncbi:MAG: c-type cytochrome [Hyphomicrobiales bacterium]